MGVTKTVACGDRLGLYVMDDVDGVVLTTGSPHGATLSWQEAADLRAGLAALLDARDPDQ